MRVVKMKEAEMVCRGGSFDPGCGSTMAVTAADVIKGKKTNYDGDGDAFMVTYRYVVCPVCGAKTEVNADLSLPGA